MNQAFEQSVLRNLHRIESKDLVRYLERFLDEKTLLQKAIDAVYFCIVILDSDNYIVDCNHTTQIFFQEKNQKNLIGQSILTLCQPEEFQIALKKLLTSNETPEYMEINIFDKLSKDYSISLSHFQYNKSLLSSSSDQPSNTEKDPFFYKVLIISDITDWKNKNLMEDQKKSIDSLHTLTASIAHEIKNPLTAIDLHLQLIRRFINAGELKTEKKLNRWVNVVSEEIKRLEAIVNDFLFSFRPIKPIKMPHKLNDIIMEVVEFFEPQCLEKKIKIKTTLDPEVKNFLFDKNQIKQAFINLFHNSIEAIEENPAVEDQGLITVVTKENKTNIETIITDNGTGIPAHKVSDIFKPFYTTKEMGTGLGLSIVSRIIHEHQGEIILNTDYKYGSQFLLEFSRLPTIHKIKQISYKN